MGGWLRVLPHLVACMALVGACGGPKQPRTYDQWKDQAAISGDLDEAEARWRSELASNPWSEEDMNHDMSLLTDDPPGPPEQYGDVAFGGEGQIPSDAASFGEGTGDPELDADAESEEFWSDMGVASFSAFTVLFTVGMAVAPYFLL